MFCLPDLVKQLEKIYFLFYLGPFLGKNFGTTIAPWVVTMDALEQFIVPNMDLKNPILDYLQHEDNYNFDIDLNVSIKSKDMENYQSVSDSNFKVNLI